MSEDRRKQATEWQGPVDKQPMSSRYREAGVDIAAGQALVSRLSDRQSRVKMPGIITNPGGFAALFDLGALDYQHPILVSGCDGVGTKLKLAYEHDHHEQIGIDLVAMCVNDVLVHGARPLFFLDYYACGRLDTILVERVLAGIETACVEAQCALTGGETAEMPGFYPKGEYDLAGFCVGIVEKERLIDGKDVHPGDALIALPSSGCHANGYALIRKILRDTTTQDELNAVDGDIYKQLLTPTRIYVATVLSLLQRFRVKAMAHITGGGLQENLPRTLPMGLAACIDISSWNMPTIFQWLQQQGQIPQEEMYCTFNCGVGMTLCVAYEDAAPLLADLKSMGVSAWQLGQITEKGSGPAVQYCSGC